jgi:uncharacterized membrane protein HdeD (DUF308 family)
VTTSSGNALFAKKQGGAQVHWVILLVLGVLAALLGVFLFFQSTSAARLLVEVLGIYWLIAGLVELIGILSDRRTPGRLFRLIAAGGAVLSGALILLSMLLGQAVAPTLTRYLIAITALLMGVLNILIGMNRAAPARGRQVVGVVYALLGIALILDPAFVPSFVLPLIGLLLIAAGGYAAYLAFNGRKGGTVALGLPAAASAQTQTKAMLNQAQQDVERITQQTKDSSLGPRQGQ